MTKPVLPPGGGLLGATARGLIIGMMTPAELQAKQKDVRELRKVGLLLIKTLGGAEKTSNARQMHVNLAEARQLSMQLERRLKEIEES